MSETTAEPLAEVTADATPAPTIDDTMSATFDAIEAREKGEDVATEPEAAEPPAGQTRGLDGKFTTAETAGETTNIPPENLSSTPPTVPDYIAPYQADFAMRGLSPDQAIPILVDMWRNIERSPQSGIAELAGRYGLKVNFGDAAPAVQQHADTGEWVDPHIVQLRQESQEMRGELQELRAERQQRIAAENAQRYETEKRIHVDVNTEIAAFKSKAAAEGIDFDLIKDDIAALILSPKVKNLEDAYNKAVYANEITRAARQAVERKQSEAQASADLAAKAQAARRAGVINVRADTGTPARGRTMDETMSRAYDEIEARG